MGGVEILSMYLVLNLGYSFGLKNIPIIDIVILALGFLLRVLFGAEIEGLYVTNWIYLTVLSGAFYLGLGKRRNELLLFGEIGRKALSKYKVGFLDKNMYMCQGITIVFYALSCMDTETKIFQSGVNLMWSVPLVLLIFMIYNMDIESGTDGDPVNIFLNDKVLIVAVSFYLIGILISIYL